MLEVGSNLHLHLDLSVFSALTAVDICGGSLARAVDCPFKAKSLGTVKYDVEFGSQS